LRGFSRSAMPHGLEMLSQGTMRAMNVAPLSSGLQAVREAVRRAPAYPFTPIDARVKLDQNESPHDFPVELKRLALDRLENTDWNRYPDIHADRLRVAIGELNAHDPHGIVVTPGSNVLIHAIAQAAGIGQRLLTLTPGFSLYALSGKLLESELTELPLEPEFGLPMDALLGELKRGSGVLFLAEPHAPTGALHPEAQIERILEAATNWIVVLDEAYYEYSGRNHLHLLNRENVCILRTFSKAWGLAGPRLGYLLAQPGLAENIQKICSPFNVSILSTVVAQIALENSGYVETRVNETLLERGRVFEALQHHKNWTVYPSHANYHLIRTNDARRAHAELLERGVLVRRQDSYPGLEGCIRVSVGTPEENTAFISAALELQ
jgi:histidinol-phosphate aminotransferase